MGFYNEDGTFEDRDLVREEQVVTCKNCGKKYRVVAEEQIAGFRDMSYDECPYCKNINGRSMQWDYSTYRID